MRPLSAAVAATAGNNAPITTAAAPVRRAPKKTGVHAAFRPICSHQSESARCFLGSDERSMRVAEYAICAYRSVHTGPNALEGGVQRGLRSVGDHSAPAPAVAAPPPAAATTTAARYRNLRTGRSYGRTPV